ncbi:TetR/AcrR family transcriptional regulator [Subsaximicrobium wynnwilliamsii]|uniref:TetR/AcrR family transcriptional regulator n=1 Tax=Subsaximicrobium wynnwilliamsii TaxID=291179 RepID=A0A5C6ZL22_9FLAO|nr:TetR/AcrR family transcriptional regulator [Subsaximicrobium wynnwilliamsii]TXD85595.1 TetR/AcrR family transcriptional regulator [Subsaximicrobium wynnwilliamsii]TXD90947.1 TetR/AcrR family transcriptional regulator [Subsaximicrobium wynnwilliamsii]TXE05455.1 TetR/AcrR family transcriptional regulator [Subsaximicrobium wynnwilliamsii]
MSKVEKSQIKREALVRATINLVNSHGFHAAPMSKIAKLAAVSPGTIYLYFENKQDLVDKVYLDVKTAFSEFAFKDYDEKVSVEKGFEKIWKNIAVFKLREVEKAMFLSQCDNTPIIDDSSRQEGLKHLQPLLNLWELGKKEGLIKPVSPYMLYAFSIYPVAFLMNMQQQGLYKLTPEHIDEAYKMAWNSIKI